jgi:type II secretory pathway pseudopilin PulG
MRHLERTPRIGARTATRCPGISVGDRRTPAALYRTSRAHRSAFTLIEITMALTVFTILGAATLSFFLRQTSAVTMTAGRMDAQQNVSFALDGIDHDLRVAGVGLGLRQPMVIEAHPYAVTFNADLVTKDTASVTAATYFDPSVADSLASALTPTNAIAYPLSGVIYPDSLYVQASGLVSNAETISYWVTLDSTTARTDDYLLLRRINSGAATVVARGIVFPGGAPAFRYFIPGATVNSRAELTSPTLPLYFKEGDVASDTMLAKLSEVRLQLTAVFKDPRGNDVYRSVKENIPLLNAGLLHVPACGAAPQAPPVISSTAYAVGDSVGISWSASADETGRHTVRSYSVYRRVGSAGPWGTPVYTAESLGQVSYTWTDYVVPLGQPYQYGVVARDCTPSLSSLSATAGTVTANP